MARKNPAAVALGRRGGRKSTDATRRAAKQNAQRAGRPPRHVSVDLYVKSKSVPFRSEIRVENWPSNHLDRIYSYTYNYINEGWTGAQVSPVGRVIKVRT